MLILRACAETEVETVSSGADDREMDGLVVGGHIAIISRGEGQFRDYLQTGHKLLICSTGPPVICLAKQVPGEL